MNFKEWLDDPTYGLLPVHVPTIWVSKNNKNRIIPKRLFEKYIKNGWDKKLYFKKAEL